MLQIRDLRRAFGDVRALDGVSFDVPARSMVGFVGRNGAGKTTTMRVVMGVTTPDAGQVTWQGRPVDTAVRLRFGYMPEERGLYPKMRVRDHLTYLARMSGVAKHDARQAATTWLERLGVDPARFDDEVETLSLGNQQRVQLAAALVHEPDLLVLDEPFSGLDPVGVDMLADVLHAEVARGVGIVFSSHQLDLVERLCDDVVIIDAGRIVESMVDGGDGSSDLRTGRSSDGTSGGAAGAAAGGTSGGSAQVAAGGSAGAAATVAGTGTVDTPTGTADGEDGDAAPGSAPASAPGSAPVAAARSRQLRVEVLGAGEDWVDAVPGVRVLGRDGARWVLELPPEVDLDQLVDAARSAGTLQHLEIAGRSLTERFRAAVAR